MPFSVVQNTTLGLAARLASRSAFRKSIPLITGMFQSSSTTSGTAARQLSSASRPSPASLTVKLSVSRMWRATLRITLESSTTRQVFMGRGSIRHQGRGPAVMRREM